MKTAVVSVILALVVLAFVVGAAHGEEIEPVGNYYAKTARVVEVDKESDCVTCVDSVGFLWSFYGAEDWQEGDCASLLMNDCGTENIFDDEICGARFNNWEIVGD